MTVPGHMAGAGGWSPVSPTLSPARRPARAGVSPYSGVLIPRRRPSAPRGPPMKEALPLLLMIYFLV